MNNTAIKAIGNFARRTWDLSVSAAGWGLGGAMGIGALTTAFSYGYDLGRKDGKRYACRNCELDHVYEWDPHKDSKDEEE